MAQEEDLRGVGPRAHLEALGKLKDKGNPKKKGYKTRLLLSAPSACITQIDQPLAPETVSSFG